MTIKKRRYYTEYMTSVAWSKKRAQVIFRDNAQCQAVRNGVKCGNRYDLEVHHLSYLNFTREPLTDLLTLCKQCHLEIHQQQNAGKKNGKARKR